MDNASSHLVKLHISLPNHWWHASESLWAQPLGDDLTAPCAFCDKLTRDEQAPALAQLEAAGAEPERADAQFVCLNIPPAVNIEAVRAMLDEHQRHGTLDYETCEERVPGSFDDKPENAPRGEA